MNLNLQPFLENDIVALRPLKQLDFDALYSVASDPLIWEQHQNKDRHTHVNFMKFFNESIAAKGALVIIDVKTEKIIGSSRFKIGDESHSVVEIGWSFLGRTYWGGDYNREFKKLMINYALQYCKYVVFYVNSMNFRSQKAMEKLGAKRTEDTSKSWVLPKEKGVTFEVGTPLEQKSRAV